jgi:hypothetical protein
MERPPPPPPEAAFPNAKTWEQTYLEEFKDEALTKGRATFREECQEKHGWME